MKLKNNYPCPICNIQTEVSEEECYQGEMRECNKCEFWAYFDEWQGGKYLQTREPF